MRPWMIGCAAAMGWAQAAQAQYVPRGTPAQQAVMQTFYAADRDLLSHAVSDCDFRRKSISYPGFAFTAQAQAFVPSTEQADVAAEWTGGCVGGRRDGFGQLTTTTRYTTSPGDSYGGVRREDGRLVRGVRRGAWCDIGSSGTRFCRIEASGGPSVGFIKAADGRWVTGTGSTSAYVSASDFEAESQRIIAESVAQRATVVGLKMQSVALAGLVRGQSLSYRPATGSLGLRSKRVAIVLSDRTIAELARFRIVRQKLLDRYAAHPVRGKFGPEFDRLLSRLTTASDPQQFLTSLATGMRRAVGDVVPAEDLSVLKNSKADYAVVVDWTFDDHLAMTEEQVDALPRCSQFEGPVNRCPYLIKASTSIMVVAPDMSVVKQAAFLDQFCVGDGNEWSPNDMLRVEVNFFELGWDVTKDGGTAYGMYVSLHPLS